MIEIKGNSESLLVLFEKDVFNGNHQKAYDALVCHILPKIDTGIFFKEIGEANLSIKSICTRLLSAYYYFIWDNKLNISDDGFVVIVKNIMLFDILRSQSSYKDSTDFYVQYIKENKNKIQDEIYAKKIILSTSPSESHIKYLNKLPKRLKFSYYCGVLASKWVLAKEGEEYRQKVMECISKDAPFVLEDIFIDRFSSAWMHCSYSLISKKHDVKKYLNDAASTWLKSRGITDVHTIHNKKIGKPRLLVISERLERVHAMYRCYGPSLESLKDYFHIINVVDQKHYDGGKYDWIDEQVVIDAYSEDICAVLKKIVSIKADMVLYPSIGMHFWSVALASIRLAPIQVMLVGHPATSNSKVIDYVVVDEGFLSDENTFSEKVVTVKKGGMPFIHYDERPRRAEIERESQDVINIAVSAAVMKINYRFLSVCRKISEKSKRVIVFHFFTARGGVELEYIRQEIASAIGDNIMIYPPASYRDYINCLSVCDLMLSAFPFGGTNSNIDAVSLGIPIVCLDGSETHSHIDIELMKRFSQPDWLSVENEDEYIDATIRLIENDEERATISKQLSSIDPVDAFNCNDEVAFGKVMHLIYLMHNVLIESSSKLISQESLEMLLNDAG